MRNGFGKFAQKLRAKRSMSQTEFAKIANLSLPRVSNIEYQRTNISDDVVNLYIAVLKCDGKEAHELRKRAIFSNELRKLNDTPQNVSPLLAMFKQFSDQISPEAAAQIQTILERETGEQVNSLCFSSNQKKGNNRAKTKRPRLNVQTLVDVSLLADKVRRRFVSETARLDLGKMLEQLSARDDTFDYRIREEMPSFVEGAFAAIIGQSGEHNLIIEESRWTNAEHGVHFARHVIAHEVGHHFLHASLLDSDVEVFLSPQELAKNNPRMLGSEREIQQVVDSPTEVEAECFATFFLVPWTAFLKGTSAKHLSSDYGEQQREIERYLPYFNNRHVIDQYRSRLWALGQRSHPVFH